MPAALLAMPAQDIAHHLQKAGFYATLLLLLATGIYGAFAGGHVANLKEQARLASAALLRSAGFAVSEVRVTGARQMTVAELFERTGLNRPTVTTLAFDAEEARRKLSEIPWIKSASVRVLLPSTVDVVLVERDPFALWQLGGRISLVDRNGDFIGAYDDDRFANLPLVVGEGAERRLVEIRELLDLHPNLRQQVRAAVLVAGRRWTLKLVDGVDIMLPEEGAREALASLERIDGQSELLKRDIAAVDLRIANRMVVRLTDRAAQLRSETVRARSKNTPVPAVPSGGKPAGRTI